MTISLPRWAWGYIAIVVAAPLLFAVHTRRVGSAFSDGAQAGRDEVVAGAARVLEQTTLDMARLEEAKRDAVAQTQVARASADSAVARATSLGHALRAAIARIPDTVRVAEVDTVAGIAEQIAEANNELAARVDSLHRAVEHERALYARASVMWNERDAALRRAHADVSLRLASAERRPRWRNVAATAVVGVAVGYAAGQLQ